MPKISAEFILGDIEEGAEDAVENESPRISARKSTEREQEISPPRSESNIFNALSALFL